MQHDNKGVSVVESFGSVEAKKSAELAAVAIASAAKAEIEAGFIVAMKSPRNEDDARQAILAVSNKPRFAEKCLYRKPVAGKSIEGLSIRFAEEAMRLWRNVKVQQTLIYEDSLRRVLKVIVYDLETNGSWSQEIAVEKHVERKSSHGRTVLSERVNTKGERVFIVEATEDEILNKTNNLASKAMRNCILRLIPEHILDEAEDNIRKAIKAGIKADPDGAKNRILDGLGLIGVKPSEVEQWLGHAIKQITEKEIVDLRIVYQSIRDGQSTWPEQIQLKHQGSLGKKPSKGVMKAGDPKNHQGHADQTQKRLGILNELDYLKKTLTTEVFMRLLGDMGFENVEQLDDSQLAEFRKKCADRLESVKKAKK